MQRINAVVILALLSTAACVRPVDLGYTAPAGSAQTSARSAVAFVTVVDVRDVPPGYAGAVMGYDGKPLIRLDASPPVAEKFADAFRDALAGRGELAPEGSSPAAAPFVLAVELLQFDAEQNAERQSQADVVIRLVDRNTGRVVYAARTYTETRGDDVFAYDNLISGSPAALGDIARTTLARVVDTSIGRAGFRAALRSAG